MSFLKVYRLHVSDSLTAPVCLALFMVLMTSQAEELDINWGRLQLLVCVFAVGAHTSVDGAVYAQLDSEPVLLFANVFTFLPQALSAICSLTLDWLFSRLTKAMLTLFTLSWSLRHTIRAHPSDSKSFYLDQTGFSQTSLDQPMKNSDWGMPETLKLVSPRPNHHLNKLKNIKHE